MEWVTTSTILQSLRDDDDSPAWDRLVRRFRRPIVAFGKELGLSPTDAEDVAQETLLAFTRGYRDGKYERSKGRLSRWLFGIAYRQAAAHRRTSRRREVQVTSSEGVSYLDDLSGDDDVQATWEREWERSVLEQCLEQVRLEVEPTTFLAFELAVREARSADAIAEHIGVSVKTVYNAKHRVLKRVRELREEFESVD